MGNTVDPVGSGSASTPEPAQAGKIGGQPRRRENAAHPQPGAGSVGPLQDLSGKASARLSGQAQGDGQAASGTDGHPRTLGSSTPRLDKVVRAVDALRHKENVVLLTDFSNDRDENGPSETAYLARSLQQVSQLRVAKGGKPMNVTVATDSANQHAVRASLDAMGAQGVKIELFDPPNGLASNDGSPGDSGARSSAEQVLARLSPDAVVSIGADGPIDMRGKSAMDLNPPLDALHGRLTEGGNERDVPM